MIKQLIKMDVTTRALELKGGGPLALLGAFQETLVSKLTEAKINL